MVKHNLQLWYWLLATKEVCWGKTETYGHVIKVGNNVCVQLSGPHLCSSTSIAVELNMLILSHPFLHIVSAAMMQFPASFIFCYTFRLIWKNSCKHHDRPSGLHKAAFGRFSLVGNLTCLWRPWAPSAPTQKISELNHCETCWVVLLLVWSGGGKQEIMHLHVWMCTDEWRHLQSCMDLTYGLVWCVTDCVCMPVWWLLQMLRHFLQHDF